MQNFAMYLLVQLFGETKISGSAVTRLQRTDKESDSMALKLDVDHSFVLKSLSPLKLSVASKMAVSLAFEINDPCEGILTWDRKGLN
ncbi:hypothetical protein M514_25419 [Trichuris suis]|uniref:Uncharacterized protein n=1 Tax=Trichuris suis TaxID=68888 RepID=A0A085MYW5_9BILA|nr:hypothetical protein M514_25419 [Trichuris suis]